LKICDFLPGSAILLKETINLDLRAGPRHWQMPVYCLLIRASPYLKICQLGSDGQLSYGWFFENPPY
jgi:hypothetical protein